MTEMQIEFEGKILDDCFSGDKTADESLRELESRAEQLERRFRTPLVRRGWELARERAVAAGMEPLSMPAYLEVLT